jgi:hypothetical protein
MAASNPVKLKTPDNFDFSKPDQWSKWKRRFKQFASASGLDKEDDATGDCSPTHGHFP